MATASASVDLPAPPDEVWALIGGFGSLPDWLPYIPSSELAEGGRVRRIETSDGGVILERLLTYDDAERRYSYNFVRSPFAVSRYLAVLQVRPGGSGSIVDWSGEFTPDGMTDEEAVILFRGIYEGGLNALAARFAKPAG